MSQIAKIDADSGAGLDNRLSFFQLPATNVAIVRSAYKELLPLNALNQSAGPFIFRYFGDSLYLDLSKTYFYLVVSLERKKADGEWEPTTDGTVAGFEGDKHVSVIQMLGLTWIRRLTLAINGTEVYDSTINYAYRAMIAHELSGGSHFQKSLYEAALYYDDGTADKDVHTGSGFKNRALRLAKGQLCRMLSHLDFDLARQDNLLLAHSDLVFTFYRNTDDFLLQQPAYKKKADSAELTINNNNYRLRLHDMRMYIKQVEITQSLNNAIARHLEQSQAKYAYRKLEIRNVFLGAGRVTVNHAVFTSTCPRRLIIGFVSADAYSGNPIKSPFTFEHANLRSISAEFGGYQFPSVPYDLNFPEGNFVHAYVNLYDGMDYSDFPNSEQRQLGISMKEFVESSCYFVIPMTSTLADTFAMELIRQGTTTIKCIFNEPVQDIGLEMIVLGEFDAVLSISADRILTSDGSV